MLSAPMRILIVAGVCALALIGLVVRESYERSRPATESSRDIDIQMQAIDPRALLAGHYVIINLVSEAAATDSETPCAAYDGSDRDGWVALAYMGPEYVAPPPPGTPFPYAPVGIAATREAAETIISESGFTGLAARGSVICSASPVDPASAPSSHRLTLTTQLPGIERFYANQDQAERIDAMLRAPESEARVYAIVNIGRDGRARLKGLNVNGEVILLNFF